MARILIVEDSWLSRRKLSKVLQAQGYELIEATDGSTALEIAATQPLDCILLDLLMPEMDGREVLKSLREQGCLTPVIIITADIQKTTRHECLELGAVDVIYKLPELEVLLSAIDRALAPNHP